jgi:antitoxin component YwqK of YwqJK toxin-antitoxin module
MPASAEPREQRETRFDNGQIKESYSVKVGKDGSFLKDGLFTSFHQSTGQKHQEGRYADDKPEGQWRTWDQAGKLTMVIGYLGGQREGEFKGMVDGNLVQQGTYRADKLEGSFSWHEIPELVIKGAMTDNLPTGVWTVTSEDGRKRAEVTFERGKRVSPVALFSSDGTPATRPAGESCATFEGFSIDTTTYWDALLARLDLAYFPKDHGNVESLGGRRVSFSQGFSAPWLKEVNLVFDRDQTLVGIVAKGDKRGDGRDFRAGFDTLRTQFKKSFKLVSESVPFVGDASANFSSGNCKIRLDAPHMSRDLTITLLSARYGQPAGADAVPTAIPGRLKSTANSLAPASPANDPWGDQIGDAYGYRQGDPK